MPSLLRVQASDGTSLTAMNDCNEATKVSKLALVEHLKQQLRACTRTKCQSLHLQLATVDTFIHRHATTVA